MPDEGWDTTGALLPVKARYLGMRDGSSDGSDNDGAARFLQWEQAGEGDRRRHRSYPCPAERHDRGAGARAHARPDARTKLRIVAQLFRTWLGFFPQPNLGLCDPARSDCDWTRLAVYVAVAQLPTRDTGHFRRVAGRGDRDRRDTRADAAVCRCGRTNRAGAAGRRDHEPLTLDPGNSGWRIGRPGRIRTCDSTVM